ncbi:hypothetical protein EUGRSUZ_C02295 [Eucalyptus grandis]|uniref:Uncharacterized protein n=2 Tax=Eucalyptus grandis TaxID=71139 RepID=A0ACC3LFN2_EUCGR|nr:hypothetical protein EUGRSUZ_C02295 [Eucalyptus grandis]
MAKPKAGAEGRGDSIISRGRDAIVAREATLLTLPGHGSAVTGVRLLGASGRDYLVTTKGRSVEWARSQIWPTRLLFSLGPNSQAQVELS